MGEKRKEHLTAKQKVDILKQVLIDRKPISNACEETSVNPRSVYLWRDQLFNEGHILFQKKNKEVASDKNMAIEYQNKIAELERQLNQKNEVISELMSEYIKQKKLNGEI